MFINYIIYCLLFFINIYIFHIYILLYLYFFVYIFLFKKEREFFLNGNFCYNNESLSYVDGGGYKLMMRV